LVIIESTVQIKTHSKNTWGMNEATEKVSIKDKLG